MANEIEPIVPDLPGFTGGLVDPLAKEQIRLELPNLPIAPTTPMPVLPGSQLPGTTDIKSPMDYAKALKGHMENAESYAQDKYKYGKEMSYDADYTGKNFARYYKVPGVFNEIGFSPWRDNESTFNGQMSWWQDFKRSAGQSWNLAGTGFSSMLPWNAWDGDSTDEKSAIEMERAHAIGHSGRDGISGFFNNLTLDAGYTMGIGAEFAAEELVIWGAGALAAPETGGASLGAAGIEAAASAAKASSLMSRMRNLGSVGKMMNKSWEGFKGLADINKVRDVYNYVKTGKPVGKVLEILTPGTFKFGQETFKMARNGENIYKMATASKGVGAFYRDAREISAVLSESKLEGGSEEIRMRDQLTDSFFKDNGRMPNADEAQIIAQHAADAGRETYLWNMPALWISNKIVFDKALRGIKPMQAFRKELSEGLAGKLAFNEAAAKAGTNAWSVVKTGLRADVQSLFQASTWKPKNLLRNVLGKVTNYGAANLTEAFQEQYQDAVSNAMTDYYTAKYKDPLHTSVHEPWGAFANRLGQQFTTKQGWETFASGFLMGSLVQFPQHIVYEKVPEKFYQIRDREGYAKFKEQREKRTNDVVNALNEVTKDPSKFFNHDTDNMLHQHAANEAGIKSSQSGDVKGYVDINDESIFNHLHTLIKTGKLDLVTDYLNDMQTLSGEELEQAYGKVDPKDGDPKEFYNKKLSGMLDKAQYLKNRNNLIEDLYSNPFNPGKYSPAKDTEKYYNEYHKWEAYEDAKKMALFSMYSFDRSMERMNSTLNEVTQNRPVAKAPGADFSILFDENQIDAEIKSLEQEVKIFEKGTAQERREAAKKGSRLEALQNFREGVIHYQEALKLEEKEQNEPTNEKVVKQKKATTIKTGTRVRNRKGEELTVTRVKGDYAYVGTRRFKRSTLEALSNTKPEMNIVEDSLRALHDSYKTYLKVIADLNNDHVFDDKVDSSFVNLKDFYHLKHDSVNLAAVVNYLQNPENFTAYASRAEQVKRSMHAQRIEMFRESFTGKLDADDTNQLLNQLFEMGVFFDPAQIEGFRNGVLPTVFYDVTTGDRIDPRSDRYKKIVDLLEKYEQSHDVKFGGKEIPEHENNAPGYNPATRNKINEDKRTYSDLAEQFGFNPDAVESEVPMDQVLETIIKSPYGTYRERALARRLKSIVSPAQTVKFKKNHHTPGTYDSINGVIIDARYNSEDYRIGVLPIEFVILHEQMHSLTVEGLASDKQFADSIQNLMDAANAHYAKPEVKAQHGREPYYGLKNREEFVAEAISNDKFRLFLQEVPYESTGKTAWTEFLDTVQKFIKRILGITDENTVLNEAMYLITTKIDGERGEPDVEAEPAVDQEVPTGGVKITSTTPVSQMPQDLITKLLEGYKDFWRKRYENNEELSDPMLFEKSDDQLVSSVQFKSFMGYPKAGAIIREYNELTGRTAEVEVETPKTTAAIKTMITKQDRQQILDLGYSRSELNSMKPEEVQRIIDGQIKKGAVEAELKEQEAAASKEKSDKQLKALTDLQAMLDAIQFYSDFKDFKSMLLELLSDPDKIDQLGINSDIITEMIEKKEIELATKVEFEELTVNEVVQMKDPKQGKMVVIEKNNKEVKLRPYGEVSGAITVVAKKDVKRVILYKDRPDMQKLDITPELTPQETAISNQDVKTAQDLNDTETIAEDIAQAKKMTDEDLDNDLINNLGCK